MKHARVREEAENDAHRRCGDPPQPGVLRIGQRRAAARSSALTLPCGANGRARERAKHCRLPRARRTGSAWAGPTELDRWPLLEKSSVRADPDAFLSGPRDLRSAREHRRHDGRAAATHALAALDRGGAGLHRRDGAASAAPMRATHAWLFCAATTSRIRPTCSRHSGLPWPAGTGCCSRRIISTPRLIDAYARALEEFRPDVLWAYPTALESLCLLLLRAGKRLSVPRVLTSSEMLAPHIWALAREALGSELLDYYGQAERVAFAYAQRPQEYRFLPGYAHVELHPTAPEGEHVLYEIVGTNLWNFAMPLPRYRTGDLVRLPASWGARELEEVDARPARFRAACSGATATF